MERSRERAIKGNQRIPAETWAEAQGGSRACAFFVSKIPVAVFYAGFSFFRAVVLEDKNSENYNERTRGKGGAYDSDCSL